MDRLRPVTNADLSAILGWRNHPDVRAMMYTTHAITSAEHAAFWQAERARADRQHFIAELDGAPRGVVSFSAIDMPNARADWAFYAALPAPPGTGRRMERLALDHAFGPLGLHKLGCEVLARNRRVIRLHRSFGFRIEGVMRDQIRRPDGWETVIRLAMLAPRWHEVRARLDTEPAR